jgi:16S rRNA (uracil1498-N3)-methyltransferase
MHRFFVAPALLATAPRITLDGALAHQIARVLRLRPGTTIALLDEMAAASPADHPDGAAGAIGAVEAASAGAEAASAGEEWLLRLERVTPALVEGRVEQRRHVDREPRLRLTLYQAPLKGEQMDYLLQKGTEVGVAAFVPVVTERTIVRSLDERKLERWRRIVREAAEQSGRTRLPALAAPCALASLARARPPAPPLWVLWEEERQQDLHRVLTDWSITPPSSLALLVGPEGGLSATEVAGLSAGGAQTLTLGPRRLRAETAGLVVASIILHASGDLGR